MRYFDKVLKISEKRFSLVLSFLIMVIFMAVSFLSLPVSCQGELPAETASTQAVQEDGHEKEVQANPDDMDVSPAQIIQTYADQLQQDLAQKDAITTFPEDLVIPDRKNTGIEEHTKLKPAGECKYIGEIPEADRSAGKEPLFLAIKEKEFYNLNGYNNGNCASRIIIDGYNFEDGLFYVTNDHVLPGEVILIFRNCRFGGIRSIPGPNLWIILDHCEIEGNIYSSNMIIRNSYLHCFNSDALNPVSNVLVKDSYIADLFREASSMGVHIDGVQIFGNRYGGISENIFFDNVRFSLPQIHYDGSIDYVNTAINTGLEFSEGRNFLFQNIVIDSGGRWFPIYNTGGDSVLFKNIQIGHGYGCIFYNRYVNPKAVVQNTRHSPGLYVSSVWKDEENRTHFLCTNNTGTERTVTVKTEQKNYTFRIERHPSPAELLENPVYREYRYQDLPYDVEFIIEEDISQAVFFDGNRQMRSVEF